MYCYVEKATRRIHDASDIIPWVHYLDLALFEIVEIPGVSEATYVWPNGDRVRCLCMTDGQILPDPAWVDRDDVRDAYVTAKAAVQAMAIDASVPLVARQAVVKLGLCLEALLLYLNKRIA